LVFIIKITNIYDRDLWLNEQLIMLELFKKHLNIKNNRIYKIYGFSHIKNENKIKKLFY